MGDGEQGQEQGGALSGALGGDPNPGGGGGGAIIPPALPSWFGEVPDDVRTEDFISRVSRYDTPVALAKGLIETQDWARGRVALPREGDEKSLTEFYAKVRPETPDAYAIPVPEGQSSEIADKFKPFAHEIGLHPSQASRLGEFWNQVQADATSRQAQMGRDELTAISLEMGESAYTQRLTAVENMLRSAGVEVDAIAPALEAVSGAGDALKALFTLAEKTGELAKVGGDEVTMRLGMLTPEAAQAKIDAHMNDKAFMDQAAIKGTREHQMWNDLNAALARAQGA